MKLRALLAVAAIAAMASGCASVSSTEDVDGSRTGIRYYNSAPFILAYSDGKGGVFAELIYLPDTTRVMSLDATAFFAQNKTTIAFEKSILKTSDTEADATAVPKAILEAAKSIASAAVAAAANTAGKNEFEVPAPYLYRIYYGTEGNSTKKTWMLKGGQAERKDGSFATVKTIFVRVVE